MSDLKSRLFEVARQWCAAQGDDVPLSRLGKRVAGDANFFARLEPEGATLHLATLERFARFLNDGAHWPAGTPPVDVHAFAHAIGIAPQEAQDHVGR